MTVIAANFISSDGVSCGQAIRRDGCFRRSPQKRMAQSTHHFARANRAVDQGCCPTMYGHSYRHYVMPHQLPGKLPTG